MTSNIAIALDTEYNSPGELIEVGLTEVNLRERRIIRSLDIPIIPEGFVEINQNIYDLTGWTTKALLRQGISKHKTYKRLLKYGMEKRLVIVDHGDEIDAMKRFFGHTFSNEIINISVLFKIKTGILENLSLEKKLWYYGLSFEGRPHKANYDSLNIARLFLELIKEH